MPLNDTTTGLVSVMIPVFNEVEAIGPLYEATRKVLTGLRRPWEMIFINDGSTDGSDRKLDEIAAADPNVRVLHFRRNFGQTAAMMAGFDHARGVVIIPLDGDNQNDPADIPAMLDKVNEGFDVVSGWRKDRQDNALQRNLPSIMANRLISGVSGVSLHDFGCSLKAYRADVIRGVRLYGEMHRFLPIYAKWHGARITEIPVNHHPRKTGSSKYGLERVMKVVLDLLTVKFMDKFMLKPMYLFGFWGLLFFAASLGFTIWTFYMRTRGYFFTATPLPMMAVFSFMTGIICVLMGLLAEMITRTFYEAQDKPTYMLRSKRNFDRADR